MLRSPIWTYHRPSVNCWIRKQLSSITFCSGNRTWPISNFTMTDMYKLGCRHSRLADGNVHCAGSATYQIFLGYRSRTRTLNPNPKINQKKQNDTGMKLNIELYLKVDFLGTGVGLQKAYNRNGKRNTYGYSRLFVVLLQTKWLVVVDMAVADHLTAPPKL